jgi:hypothetical protein
MVRQICHSPTKRNIGSMVSLTFWFQEHPYKIRDASPRACEHEHEQDNMSA